MSSKVVRPLVMDKSIYWTNGTPDGVTPHLCAPLVVVAKRIVDRPSNPVSIAHQLPTAPSPAVPSRCAMLRRI